MDSSATDLMHTVTHNLSLWDNYIRVTGGMIERMKTAYSLLTWKFLPLGEPIITLDHELPKNQVVIHRDGYDTSVK
eukprot:13048189-Ditylum_brightwellii.AAC.1